MAGGDRKRKAVVQPEEEEKEEVSQLRVRVRRSEPLPAMPSLNTAVGTQAQGGPVIRAVPLQSLPLPSSGEPSVSGRASAMSAEDER